MINLLFAFRYCFAWWKWYQKDLKLEMRSTKLASSIWLPLLFWIFLLIFQEFVPIKASDNQSAVVELVKSQAVFVFLDAVLLAPIVEELMFRGFRATFFFPQQRKLPQILLYRFLIRGSELLKTSSGGFEVADKASAGKCQKSLSHPTLRL
ncbi:Membrane-bound protease, CAAX family [Streptococcus sp. DD11]|nr:Membrane-bound protease, CAAX family [Streptococcus sp. DD11]